MSDGGGFMKALDMKPTSDNLFDALKEDTVGRNEDVFRFASILNKINGRCSIAVDGNWGSGKTFLVKQVVSLSTFRREGKRRLKSAQRRVVNL